MSVDYKGNASQDALRIGVALAALQNVPGVTMTAWTDIDSMPDPAVHRASAFCEYSVGGALNDNSRFAFELQNNAADPPGRCYATVTRRLDADAGSEDQTPPGTAAPGRVFVAATVNYLTGQVIFYKFSGVGLSTVSAAIASWAAGGNTSNTTSSVAGIGTSDDGLTEFTDGRLEDLRIYSRVLSADEIQCIFECQGVDGIVFGLQSRFELQSGSVGQLVSTLAAQDSAQQQTSASAISGTPSYAESIGPTFRRRLA